MIEVNIKDNESLERALRRFKKKWERSGVLKEVKRKAFYEKPSVTTVSYTHLRAHETV